MLLNILKCDGCNKEIEYTCRDDYYIFNLQDQVGRDFKYYKNENNAFESEKWNKYHLCNKCFDTVKEKLDNVISEFKGDDCSQEDKSILRIICDSDIPASTKALVSHAYVVEFSDGFVFHFQRKHVPLFNQQQKDRIATVLSKHFKKYVGVSFVADNPDSCDCGQ